MKLADATEQVDRRTLMLPPILAGPKDPLKSDRPGERVQPGSRPWPRREYIAFGFPKTHRTALHVSPQQDCILPWPRSEAY